MGRRVLVAMRCGIVPLACLGLAGCSEEPPPPQASSDMGELTADVPATPTYTVRLDSERSDPGQFQLTEEDDALRILTGPAGIAYRPEDVQTSGELHVEATFVQYSAPVGYREAYGVFVGGRELDTEELEYTYLLVRPTGDILIKRRIGEITETILDWAPNDAVTRVVAEGDEPENRIGIDVVDGETRFMVNGIQVHSMPAAEARPYGVAGIRANHRLDIRVTEWLLGPLVGTFP